MVRIGHFRDHVLRWARMLQVVRASVSIQTYEHKSSQRNIGMPVTCVARCNYLLFLEITPMTDTVLFALRPVLHFYTILLN